MTMTSGGCAEVTKTSVVKVRERSLSADSSCAAAAVGGIGVAAGFAVRGGPAGTTTTTTRRSSFGRGPLVLARATATVAAAAAASAVAAGGGNNSVAPGGGRPAKKLMPAMCGPHYCIICHNSAKFWKYRSNLTPEEQQLLLDIRRRKAELLKDIQQLQNEIAEVTSEMETLDPAEDTKNNLRAKQLSIGRKKFNMDPKKGIEWLMNEGLIGNTPLDIAQFLYAGEGLNKTAIGDYLGEKEEQNQKVLHDFVRLHDFNNLLLVQALRQFLWSFRLPGEAQKIDRMMECFAQHYCTQNPSIFTNADTCYVLSFAIIMLNTSLHNPCVKDKPPVEQFVSMNRGIDNGADLPRELLVSLYENIKSEPFKIPEDDGNDLMHTFFNPDKEGWLWKQGGRIKSWKRRWFILNDKCLYYFEYTTDKEPRGIIPLENIQVREVQDRSKPHCFELYASSAEIIKACKTDSDGKVVEGKHTVYRMSAASQEEKDEWMMCLRRSSSHHPFYDMLAARKRKAKMANR